MTEHRTYVPALRFRWLTRWYDPILRAALQDERFKVLLIAHARIAPGDRVLDLGCGTGTLTIMLKRAWPSATIVGLDGDPAVLAIARQKASAAGVAIELYEGLAFAPPFAPGSFDLVMSSLLFHHLTPEDKRRTLTAVYALLRPGGVLHVADWGQAQTRLMRLAFLGIQLLDGFRTTGDNVRRGLIPYLRGAGFVCSEETHREMTVFGTLALYTAIKPAGTGLPDDID